MAIFLFFLVFLALPLWFVFVTGMFGIILLSLQVVLTFLACMALDSSLDVPDGVLELGFFVPFIVSMAAWRLASHRWSLRVDSTKPHATRLRDRRLMCIVGVIPSLFLMLVLFPALRRASLGARRSRYEAEAAQLKSEADLFTGRHHGCYPDSLTVLPPISDPQDANTAPDVAQFEYFGKGLTTDCAPDLVLLASTKHILDDAHILVTSDGTIFEVGPIGFSRIQTFLQQHIPRSQWK